MEVKEESENVVLKLNIQKTKIIAFGPIASWQVERETMETVRDSFWGAPKSLQIVIAAMKLKDASYDQPRQHIKKLDITLPTKVHLVKAMVFPVVKCECES